MTKQEFIKSAYIAAGVDWEAVKEYVDEDGYFFGDDELLEDEFFHSSFTYCKKHEACNRPKSLRGIEDNNGWLPLDKSVPNVHSSYFVYDVKQKGRVDIFTGNLLALTGCYTHYQPIVKPSLPLY